MITTTNDVEHFIENIYGPLFIYGVGRVGYRVADFMFKTGIQFAGFIDKAAEEECFQKVGGVL
ncbi:hypothetical protein [Butyrivibrio sp. AE2032]|uniref:hypothetical protein n=1 Tax=Butyrivibrio sp. AE2032 TaxID=1458463 RepID=UPI0005598578|nr:hypothetical protein [Butyrivibrio sp. AE2032]